MKYAAEMVSGAMVHIPSFIKSVPLTKRYTETQTGKRLQKPNLKVS
jgi:hypothetical protein